MIAADASEATLNAYALCAGDTVDVELLVIGQPTQVAPRTVTGTVDYATGSVLVLNGGKRIPWRAIALITATGPVHPATI